MLAGTVLGKSVGRSGWDCTVWIYVFISIDERLYGVSLIVLFYFSLFLCLLFWFENYFVFRTALEQETKLWCVHHR